MAAPNLVVSAVAEWNGKALTKASGQIGKFDKTVKNLGRTLGVTFSAAALLSYSKKALAAYGEQIAEAKRLDKALRNIGFSFASSEAEGYLDTVEKVTGINRDQLQPAFIQLAQITRSTTIAQSMLNTALDVSAGTGLDLISTTKILSQAYTGNYKGLKQLDLGLTNAELAGKSYLQIEKLLAIQYAGQSKLAADSYQGSLDRLKIAAEQASEQIGQSLVSALSISSGGMDKLINKVDDASDSIAGMITNTSYLIKELGKLPGAGVLSNIKDAIFGQLGKFSIGNIRKLYDQVTGKQGGFPQGLPADLKNFGANTEKAKMDKLALQRQKELLALQKKAAAAAIATANAKKLGLAIDKANLVLGKGGDIFDMEKIQLEAARISQVQQLAKATSAAQLLAITNDLARLQVLKDMKALEDAIASGDIKRIEAATAKLNADIKILGVLTQQELKLLDIKAILTALASKDLINLTNLNEAARILGLLNIPAGGKITVEISAAAEAALAALAAATAAAKLAAGTIKKKYTSDEINDIIRRLTQGEKITVSEGAAIGVSDPKSLKPDPIGPVTPPVVTTTTSTFGDKGLLSSIIAAVSIAATVAAENAAAIKAANAQAVTVNNNFNGVIGDPNALATLITDIVQNAIDRGTIKATTLS
jgi:hypothetical protein